MEERGPNGELLARHVHGSTVDELVLSELNGAVYYYHQDHLNSTIAVTDDSGNVVEQYRYDVYGHPFFYGPDGSSRGHSALRIRFLFSGREWLASLGLYDYRHRAYSPSLGRFLQMDPLGFGAGEVNLYRAGYNGLLRAVDPFGLLTIFIPGAGPDYAGYANADFRDLANKAGARYVSRHRFGKTKEAIREAAKQGEPIKIVGYSRGAVSAVKLARDLEKEGIKVDVLISLDPVASIGLRESIDVPRNVRRAFNYYQDIGGNPLKGEFRGTPLTPRENVYNIKVQNVRHPEIPSNPEIQQAVLTILGTN